MDGDVRVDAGAGHLAGTAVRLASIEGTEEVTTGQKGQPRPGRSRSLAAREFNAAFGLALREARKAMNLTTAGLGELAAMTDTTIRSMEVGKGTVTAHEMLVLMQVLGMKELPPSCTAHVYPDPPALKPRSAPRPRLPQAAPASAIRCCELEATGIEGEHSPGCPEAS